MGLEIQEPNTCIRGCCRSSKIPLHLPPSTFTLGAPIAKGAESIVYEARLDGKTVAVNKPVLSSSDHLDKFHKELQLLCKLDHPGLATLVAAHAKPLNYMFFFPLYEKQNLADKLHVEEWTPTIDQVLTITFQLVKREIHITKLFAHPHVVRLYEVIETERKLLLAMELMNSGDLFDYVTTKDRLQEDEARHSFQQIISGVECCHLKGVLHRDIKPENLVLDVNRNLKIADFGLSDVQRDGHFLKAACGSHDYAAPEVMSERHYAGLEVDVWSCGVYVLLCVKTPFRVDRDRLYTKSPAFRLPDYISSDAKDLITGMLDLAPVNRISIPEMRRNPWFQHNLPPYIAMQPNDVTSNGMEINEDIVREVVKIGFNVKTVVKSLRNGLHNEATVSYFLFLDNLYQANRSDIQTELPQIESNAPPLVTMREMIMILQGLNVRFKKIGHYNVKCLWLPQFFTCSISKELTGPTKTDHICSHELSITSMSTSNASPRVPLKFELQLYKASEHTYLLDMQRIRGPPLLFHEICSAIHTQMLLRRRNINPL